MISSWYLDPTSSTLTLQSLRHVFIFFQVKNKMVLRRPRNHKPSSFELKSFQYISNNLHLTIPTLGCENFTWGFTIRKNIIKLSWYCHTITHSTTSWEQQNIFLLLWHLAPHTTVRASVTSLRKVSDGQFWLFSCHQERHLWRFSSLASPLETTLHLANVEIHTRPIWSLFCILTFCVVLYGWLASVPPEKEWNNNLRGKAAWPGIAAHACWR